MLARFGEAGHQHIDVIQFAGAASLGRAIALQRRLGGHEPKGAENVDYVKQADVASRTPQGAGCAALPGSDGCARAQ